MHASDITRVVSLRGFCYTLAYNHNAEKEDSPMTIQEKYMKAALRLAQNAADEGEVPVGAVIVCDGKIVGRGRNRRETRKDALCHAELEAIHKACKKLGGWRLHQCDLYVTLEPCQMCSGAIVQARIPQVVIGCMNPKAGCAGSILNLLEMPEFNHQVQVIRGILEKECSTVLKQFFKDLRIRNKLEKTPATPPETPTPAESDS